MDLRKNCYLIILFSYLFIYNFVKGDQCSVIPDRNFYAKVSSSLTVDLNWTRIASFYTGPSHYAKYMCLGKCTNTPECSLACYNDVECGLYRAVVSKHWNPDGPYVIKALLATLHFTCYTSWIFPGDLTSKIISSRQSSGLSRDHAFCALNGYYGIYNNGNALATFIEFQPWVEFEFDEVVKISKIVVKTRVGIGNVGFTDVVAKIGHFSSLDSSFISFSLIGTHSGPSAQGELVVFEPPIPMYGKFLAFKVMNPVSDILGIGDLKVF